MKVDPQIDFHHISRLPLECPEHHA
jgi:hypothetical protein